jgi:CrcB protein
VLYVGVALGGALGAVLRWLLGDAAINVSGSAVLALLPAITAVRRSHLLTAALGPGLCGGYTTLSAYSEQSRALLADGRYALAATYLLGTLAACLLVVVAISHLSTRAQREEFEAEGGDE